MALRAEVRVWDEGVQVRVRVGFNAGDEEKVREVEGEKPPTSVRDTYCCCTPL